MKLRQHNRYDYVPLAERFAKRFMDAGVEVQAGGISEFCRTLEPGIVP